jgi:hypothetical protein
MTAFLLITAVAYLAGAASAVFLVAVIGIRKGDRPERILNAGSHWSESCSRRILNSRTWPDIPVYRPGREDGWPGHPGFPTDQ